MVKRGDTLIEVTLAIGIFSMVAISVVAVMTSGTSNAQNALETTLAREEIDTQAEALRFIHASYLADDESGEKKDPYSQLWTKIVENAYRPTKSESDSQYLQYNPTSCDEVIESKPFEKSFIINPRALASLSSAAAQDNRSKIEAAITDTYIKSNSSTFRPASTYPRLIYTSAQVNNTDSLIENSNETKLKYAEGIYVLAVADASGTNVVGATSAAPPAYYDFYIRTCWYGTGSETPSTISTVIRLYNPKGIEKK